MSRTDTWMPLYIGDYMADTMHLSGAEHGAYLLLLMHSWRAGPLPDDDRKLAAIARTDMRAWKGMGETIRAFFQPTEDGLVSPRLERERARADQLTEQRRLAGKASAAQREAQRAFNDRSTSVDPPLPSPLQRNGQQTPIPSQSQSQREEDTSLRSVSPARDARLPPPEPRGFAEFWEAYPAKVGKAAARKAFPRAVKVAGGDPSEIVFGLKARLHLFPAEQQFIPNPATWLNQGRWDDDPETLFARSQRSN